MFYITALECMRVQDCNVYIRIRRDDFGALVRSIKLIRLNRPNFYGRNSIYFIYIRMFIAIA